MWLVKYDDVALNRRYYGPTYYRIHVEQYCLHRSAAVAGRTPDCSQQPVALMADNFVAFEAVDIDYMLN